MGYEKRKSMGQKPDVKVAAKGEEKKMSPAKKMAAKKMVDKKTMMTKKKM
jgi:hypothetical protein